MSVDRLVAVFGAKSLTGSKGSDAGNEVFDKQTFKSASLILCSESCEWPVLGVEQPQRNIGQFMALPSSYDIVV